MIWIPCTTDSDAQVYTVDGSTVGVVRFMKANKKFMASTHKNYLGYYANLKNAQLAVEAKYDAEVKATGKLL